MRRSLAAAFVALTFTAAACSSGTDTAEVTPAAATDSTEAADTTTTEAPTTTAAPETTTTTAAPQPVALASSGARAAISPNGIVVPVKGVQGDAALVGTPCGNTVPLAAGFPITEAAVVLDAGHGGEEPGAVGPNGLTEKALNLEVQRHAAAALERAGISTVVTRSGDYRITLGARAEIVKALQPKAFVSIHHNAEPDEQRATPGAETYYQIASADSKRLAGLIYEEVVKALSQYQLTWVADRDAGTKYLVNSKGGDYYGILRLTAGVPAVLAELGFISNPAEAELYARPDVQQVEGEAVARGIIRYLTTSDPGSGFVDPYPRESPAGGGGGGSGCTDPAL